MKTLLTFSLLVATAFAGYDYPNCNDKQVIVHLFEWSWGAIARECEEFLGPKGFCGVQVSPPNEHIQGGAWWTRYQPVSYILGSRSGDRGQFVDMVQRCNAAGVNVIVDLVINHMSAGSGGQKTGSAGSTYNGDTQDYPAVPFSSLDFHQPVCDINNYQDPNNVRNCYLVGLNDLDGGKDYVRGKIADYVNDLISIGVKGFRVDAAKHMWPADLEAMEARWDTIGGESPFVFHEVINQGGEPITTDQYYSVGKVTEFKACNWLACIRDSALSCLTNFGTSGDPSYTNGLFALTFVDNHDNQRGHGGSGGPLTYKESYNYKLATGFHLATDYGFKRIMSSYDFSDSDQGPPGSDPQGITNGDLTCGNGWICEHRWSSIGNMAQFANKVVGTGVDNWQDHGASIGFSRGNKGFFAFGDLNNEPFYTGLPAGSYCDIIHDCAQYITVDSNGNANFSPAVAGDNMVAICQDCGCLGGSNLGC